jgi:hypothetical protein
MAAPFTTNCPFYGRHAVLFSNRLGLFVDSQGNQCGLAVDSFSPCAEELEAKPVEWSTCPRWLRLTATRIGRYRFHACTKEIPHAPAL